MLDIDKKKRELKVLGDLCSDFGANVKFVIGAKKKYKNNNVKNLKTNISNKKLINLLMVIQTLFI